MLPKISLRPLYITRPVTAWSNRQRKEKCYFFFLFWLEEFHSIVLSILMKLNFKKMRRKKKKKREIQINKEPKLRIKSEITVIIFAVDKGKTRL